MNETPDPIQFFTDRTRAYARFIRLFRYEQGLRACFMRWALLRSGMRILDAGCGTGTVTIAMREAMIARGLAIESMHGFDLTPAMLGHFRDSMRKRNIGGVELMQANVLALEGLPPHWKDYDLIVSASMLEYVPRDQFAAALSGLRGLLGDDGNLLLFITRNNWLMRPLIGRWWQSNLYTATQLKEALPTAGFSTMAFRYFPPRYCYLALWGRIIEAHR